MKKTLILLFAVLAYSASYAAPRKVTAMKASARAAINSVRKQANAPLSNVEPKELHRTAGTTIFGYADGGFAVIANDDVMPEVLGVSDAKFSNGHNPSFQWWLNAINEVCTTMAANGGSIDASNVPTPLALGFEPRVDPIVTAQWDQEAPYSNLCPRDRNNRRCLTGCVATAISQVLYTHRTPVNGSGTRTNRKSYSSYQNPNGSYEDVTFVYDGYVPDYDNMIDCYTSGSNAGNYNSTQAEAVAKLMLACGVAVNMDYASDGSGAYTDQAAEGLIQYMGITTADFKEREYYSDTEWMTMVYEELAGGHAMYYSAVDSNPWTGGGHAFVCDGYNEQGHVHINWGWSGEDDGFYNINLLNPKYYQFSEYQDFIRGLWDPNETSTNIDLVDLTLNVSVPGTLLSRIGDVELATVRSLFLSGTLNDADFALIRDLASGANLLETYGQEGEGHLSKVDLCHVALADSALPEGAFRNANKLRFVVFPHDLLSIGKNAFNGCTALTSIKSYTYNVPQTGSSCFTGVPSNVNLLLIAGSTDNYKRNAQWKSLVTSGNVHEFGTSLIANSSNRKYGDANPVLGYKVAGERVVGAPKLTCSATKTSPVGKYEISIAAGTVQLTDDIALVPGALNVQKAALTIAVKDTVRAEGEENPEFEFIYTGFKNDETAEVLTALPVASTTADINSPVGEYTVTVSGAQSPNYNITYVPGTLTVVENNTATAIRAVKNAKSFDVYSVTGTLVLRNATSLSSLPSGLYIINGKKVTK